MNTVTQLLAAAPPTPTPLPFDPNAVTPGVIGFGFTFVVFLVVGLIAWDLLRRVRNAKYREQVRDELAAEAASTPDADADTDGGAEPTPQGQRPTS